MNTRATCTLATVLAVGFAALAPARADICTEYRTAIDAFVAESAAVIALDDTIEAARKGIRAARATRSALRTLESEPSMKILEGAGAANPDELEAADAASTAAIETFEAIYKRVKAVTDEIAGTLAAEFDEARIAADAAAEPALDTLGTVQGLSRRAALKATSTSARASHGKATSTTLISVHESIQRAACE